MNVERLNELKRRVLQQINLTDQTESLCWDECCNLIALVSAEIARQSASGADVALAIDTMLWLKDFCGRDKAVHVDLAITALQALRQPVEPCEESHAVNQGYADVWYGQVYTCYLCGHRMCGIQHFCHNCGRELKGE